jgi:hypothetical protein
MMLIVSAVEVLGGPVPLSYFPNQYIRSAFSGQISAVMGKSNRAIVNDVTESVQCSELLFSFNLRDVNSSSATRSDQPAVRGEYSTADFQSVTVKS